MKEEWRDFGGGGFEEGLETGIRGSEGYVQTLRLPKGTHFERGLPVNDGLESVELKERNAAIGVDSKHSGRTGRR